LHLNAASRSNAHSPHRPQAKAGPTRRTVGTVLGGITAPTTRRPTRFSIPAASGRRNFTGSSRVVHARVNAATPLAAICVSAAWTQPMT